MSLLLAFHDRVTTMVEVNGDIEELTPENYQERSVPVGGFILEQLADPVRTKSLDPHVFVSSGAGVVLRNRTFRRGWFNDAAESMDLPGLLTSYLSGAPCRIRTDDPRFTRAVLWPTELRGQTNP